MDDNKIEIIRKIHKIFKSKKLGLSLAESCTAGYVSHLITSLPGSSAFFDSSVICYSIKSKKKLLGIKGYLLKKYGVVSEETARAMAEAVRAKTMTDFSLSVTGNLGPKAIEGKRIGLVFLAVSFDKGTESKGMIFDGARNEIKEAASIAAMEFLHGVVSVWR